MDLVSLALVGAFCLAGAVIAYGADILGRHLGKKRHSIFGLRPRHTATLFTTIGGFFIPLLTVALMWLVSQDVRTIIREGSRAAAERDRVVRDLQGAVQQVRQRTVEIQTLELQRGEAQTKLTRAAQQVADQQQEVRSLQERSAELRDQLKATRARVEIARKGLETLRSQVRVVEEQYEELKTTYALVDQRLREANDAVIQKDLELRKYERQIESAQARFEELQKREKQAREELEETTKQYTRLQTAFDEQKVRSDRELELKRLEYDRLQTEAQNLLAITQSLKSNVDSARLKPMVFQVGEEIARLSVPAGSSDQSARESLTSLLRSARVVVQQRQTDFAPAQGVAGFLELRADNRTITVEEQERLLVQAVKEKPEQTVLIANALWNSFGGEFVPLRVQSYPNPIVYRQGQTIADARIDGDTTEEAILNQISKFLTEKVKERARLDRMIPAAGREDQFGTIGSDQVLALVREIQAAARVVRLVAVAAQETRAADVLRLEFRIR